PFTHVGLRRLVTLRDAKKSAEGSDLVLKIRAWPLELVNDAPLDADLIAEEVEALREQVAPDLFAGFDRSRFPATSIPALALTDAAYAAGPAIGERVALALRDALFEEGRDIAAADVLLDIAEGAGIGLPDHGGRECVVEDWHEGQQR